MPGYSGNGSIDPLPPPVSISQEFIDFIDNLVAQEKTDGVQYSTELGTSIRRWADEATALSYKNFIDQQYFNVLEVPTDNNTFVIEDIPT